MMTIRHLQLQPVRNPLGFLTVLLLLIPLVMACPPNPRTKEKEIEEWTFIGKTQLTVYFDETLSKTCSELRRKRFPLKFVGLKRNGPFYFPKDISFFGKASSSSEYKIAMANAESAMNKLATGTLSGSDRIEQECVLATMISTALALNNDANLCDEAKAYEIPQCDDTTTEKIIRRIISEKPHEFTATPAIKNHKTQELSILSLPRKRKIGNSETADTILIIIRYVSSTIKTMDIEIRYRRQTPVYNFEYQDEKCEKLEEFHTEVHKILATMRDKLTECKKE
jgi:hypothetical protein